MFEDNKFGFLVPPGSPKDIADKLIQLVDYGKVADSIQNNMKQRIYQYFNINK